MNQRVPAVAAVLAASVLVGLSPMTASAAQSPAAPSSSITTTTTSADGSVSVAVFPAVTSPFASRLAATPTSPTPASPPSNDQPAPAPSGVVTVTLNPLPSNPVASRSAPSSASAAAAKPVIRCFVNLGQYVHYSKKGGDTSWHWTWRCDDAAELSAHSILYYKAFGSYSAVASGNSGDSGVSGDINIRTNTCFNGSWYGAASGLFSAPGYASNSFEGASPANNISC